MDNNFGRFRELSNSSGDDLPFSDLEESLYALLDNRPTNNHNKTLRDFFVEEKINYFLQISSCLEETKANFLTLCKNLNKNVEGMMLRLVDGIRARELELKSQLEQIKMEKLAKWERQLFLCREALRELKNPVVRPSNSAETCLFEFRFNVEIQSELEFIDAGDTKFEAVNYQKILKNVKSLGKITYHRERDWKEFGSEKVLTSIRPKFVFGGSGDDVGKFCRPWGVCSDATNRILICDRSNHRIQVFSESGEFLMAFGKEGSKSGEFKLPSGLDVDEKCRIVVADKDNHRIQVFTYSGAFIYKFGSFGSNPGQFSYPWDVSVNKYCDIAVSDSKNHRIQLFDERGRLINLLDAKKMGVCHLRKWLNMLDSPRGLAFRADGSLLATDFNNHRIVLIDQDFSKMWFFGEEGVNHKQFFRPQGIACDKDGRFAVADSKNYRVQVFDNQGNVIQCFGQQGNKPGQFDCPLGISFHANRNIVVVDFNNNRIQVF